nr:MAG: putative RNA-dependent RNA polymerase [Mitoviridae sp.]
MGAATKVRTLLFNMKLQLRKFHVKWLSAYRLNIKRHANVMASVKRGKALIRVCLALFPIIGFQPTSSRVRLVVVFLRKLALIFKHNGAKGACLMLKCFDVTLQQSSGGYRVHNITELKFRVSRTHSGYPRVIPREVRKALRDGDAQLMRLYRSLFNLFALLEFKGDHRLASLSKSIVTPGVDTPQSRALKAEIAAFMPHFVKMIGTLNGMSLRDMRRKLERAYANISFIPILKSSPFTMSVTKFEDLTPAEQVEAMAKYPLVSTHPTAIWKSVQGFKQDPKLYANICYFLSLVKDDNPIKRIFFQLGQLPVADWAKTQATNPQFSPAMGKLGLKEEAAGKVRVFAMVDPWTQWVLRPLHEFVQQDILNKIPQDGTTDQMKPAKALLNNKHLTGLWSLDLSSATDRLPLDLQLTLHANLFGLEFAQNWASLLVSRCYKLTLMNKNTDTPVNYYLKYAVGQPMGAYSSWNSLAITHHLIVQFAAYKAGYVPLGTWYKNYAIVGDDVVIGNASVAKKYLRIMKVLGVGIGLHKSLLSPSAIAFEFCKRTFWRGQDVSPVRFVELQSAFNQPAAAVEFIKKYKMTWQSFVKAAGFKFNVLGKLNQPFQKLNSKVKLLVLAVNVPYTAEDINAFFSIGIPKNREFCFETLEVMQVLMDSEFKRIKKALNSLLSVTFQLEGKILHLRDAAKEMLFQMDSSVIPLRSDLAEDLAWAEAQCEGDPRSHLNPLTDWIEGEGFIMIPPQNSAFSQFGEWAKANPRPEAVLATVERLCERYRLGVLEGYLKPLEILVQGRANEVIKSQAMELNRLVIHVMLHKWDMSAAEVWTQLIEIQKALGALPTSQVKYQRLIDDGGRGFTEGMHIRLWKSLSNVSHTRVGVTPKPIEPQVKTGGYLWF